MAPLEDKLIEMLPPEKTVRKELIESGRIQAMPINYLRGASWKDKIVVADEAQNFTFKELTTLITRLGKNSKLFICGDFMQSILAVALDTVIYLNFSMIQRVKKTEYIAWFTKDDILRSELQKFIIAKLEKSIKK